MTPCTGRWTFSAIAADSRATFWAAGCGVVTTSTSARGRYWLRLSAMSPVPGRHVDQQELGVVPEHVGEELLQRLVEHRAPPDHGLALGHEVAHRDAADAPLLRRHQHLVDHDRVAVGAEHAGDGEAVDVGVDHADRVAPLGQRDGEVGGDAGLADAALAGGDEQRAGARARLGEGDLAALGVPVGRGGPGAGGGIAVEAGCRSASRSSSVMTVKSSATPVTPSSGRTAAVTRFWISLRSGQPATVSATRTPTVPSALQVDVAHHAQVDDRAPQLGILHRAQRFDDLLGGDGHERRRSSAGVRHAGRGGGNYHYGDR